MKRLNLRESFPKFKEATTSQRSEIKDRVSTFLVSQINRFLDGSNSPVSGGRFKKFKKDKSPSQLFEKGDMRSQIESRTFRDGVDTGIFKDAPKVERLKMFNHNVGDTLPVRQAIPRDNQNYKRKINDGISRIIREVIGGN